MTTTLTLPRMVDLALNTPEVGIVNFTFLHSILHVIIEQLGIGDVNVQFKGDDSERVKNFIKCAKTGTSFTLKHVIGGEDDKGKKQKSSTKKKDTTTTEGKEVGNIIFENTVTISKQQLENFDKELKNLSQKVEELAELPGDAQLIQAVASSSHDKNPVLDIYQILNLTKRLDAIEVSIEKFASILETLTRATASTDNNKVIEDLKNFSASTSKKGSDNLEQRVVKLESAIKLCTSAVKAGAAHGKQKETSKPSKDVVASPGSDSLIELIESLQAEIADIKSTLEDLTSTGETKASIVKKEPKDHAKSKTISEEPKDHAKSKTISEEPKDHAKKEAKDKIKIDSDDPHLENRIVNMENRFLTIEEQLGSLDNGFSRQVNALTNRVTGLETEVGEMQEKMNLQRDPNDGKSAELSLTAELHKQLNIVQDEMKAIEDKMVVLLEERDNREHSFEVLAEQVQLLKAVKADREDLEDALADKADACLINKKVSFEQFDQACGDMSRSIEAALVKLTQQEVLWSNALEDLQKDIGGKMDRMELSPLKDFIHTKIKGLQEKLKTLTALKKEHEAAGTKSKFLRNVNCISCDKDVVMRKEVDPSIFPKATALPPTRSMGPYLAYELDQLRKQQKCLPSSKNLNMLENAMLAGKSAKSPDHICNRYCGGSHTVTTPQQRVARVGHFLEQWGPEIAPVNDVHVRGTDGQMYKARDDDHLRQLASEKGPSANPDQKPSFHISGDAPKRSSSLKSPEKGQDDLLRIPSSARS